MNNNEGLWTMNGYEKGVSIGLIDNYEVQYRRVWFTPAPPIKII